MNQRTYLITGPSASGKTSLAEQLTTQGYAAVDIDSTQGLAFFVNQNGKPVPYPADADAGWWQTHHYIWELDRLRKLIDTLNPPDGIVFVAGNAGNISKAWDTFEAVFYLDLPKDLMIKRMAGKDRAGSFGQRIAEQDQLVRWVDDFKAEMLELGAVSIDATQPLDKVAAAIVAHVKKKPAKA